MGQFWDQESAVGHKWSNFQPFRFKFALYTWFLGISTEDFNIQYTNLWRYVVLFVFLFFFYLFRCPTSYERAQKHKTASLADEGNSAYCQSSGALNIGHYVAIPVIMVTWLIRPKILSLKSLYIYNDIILNFTIWSLKRIFNCLWLPKQYRFS